VQVKFFFARISKAVHIYPVCRVA